MAADTLPDQVLGLGLGCPTIDLAFALGGGICRSQHRSGMLASSKMVAYLFLFCLLVSLLTSKNLLRLIMGRSALLSGVAVRVVWVGFSPMACSPLWIGFR